MNLHLSKESGSVFEDPEVGRALARTAGELKAENLRLQAALHEIVDVLHAVKSGPRAVDEAEMIALAALATQGGRSE